MNWLREKWLAFYRGHIQKTLGTLIAGWGALDLLSAVIGQDQYLVTLVGPKWTAALHLVAGAAIAWRARAK